MNSALVTVLPAASTVNFGGAWSKFWGAINSGTMSRVFTLLTIVGVLLIVMAVVGYVFERRRGGGGGVAGSGKLGWALAAGMLLAAPNLIIPLILVVIDALANALARVLGVA